MYNVFVVNKRSQGHLYKAAFVYFFIIVALKCERESIIDIFSVVLFYYAGSILMNLIAPEH